jgi:uncharacterized protein (UPF0333 family)
MTKIYKVHRAQLSLEFIIILAITLSFLALWLPVIVSTQKSTQANIDDFYLKNTAEDISHSSDTLCILGEGNEREITIVANRGINITSSRTDNSFTVSDGISNISKDTKCMINISGTIQKGRTNIILKNENEIISIR